MATATQEKVCRLCSGKMLDDGDQERCIDCNISQKQAEKTYVCPGAVSCDISECSHYLPHKFSLSCKNGCFANSGCIPIIRKMEGNENENEMLSLWDD